MKIINSKKNHADCIAPQEHISSPVRAESVLAREMANRVLLDVERQLAQFPNCRLNLQWKLTSYLTDASETIADRDPTNL